MKRFTFLIAICLASYQFGISQVQSEWRNLGRTGIYNETGLLKEWPEDGPPMLWSDNKIGTGWGSVSVTDEGIYIVGKLENDEYCSKLNLKGQLIWQRNFGRAWDGSYPDARSTPTIVDNKVYVISGLGDIACLDAISGKVLWTVDGYTKFDGSSTMWGVCESPLIVNNNMIYTPGGSKTTMVALDKDSGKTVWMSESLKDSTAYVSPLLVEHGGKKIITSILANYFFGVDAENGEILWKYKYYDLKWKQTHHYSPIINCNTPLFDNGMIFISKGYNHLAALFSLNKSGTEINLIRTDSLLDVHIGGMVLHEGYLYGSNWLNNSNGNWCCINWITGEKKYETHWANKGSIILADGMLYCYEERTGNIALVEANPSGFNIISSFKVPLGSGPYWSHPVIKKGVLYIRHGDVLMAYDIKA